MGETFGEDKPSSEALADPAQSGFLFHSSWRDVTAGFQSFNWIQAVAAASSVVTSIDCMNADRQSCAEL